MIAAHLIEIPIISHINIPNWDDLLFGEQRKKIAEVIRRIDVEREWNRLIVYFNNDKKIYLKMQAGDAINPREELAKLPALKQLLLLAHHIQQFLDSDKAKNLKEISEWTETSTSRLYQIMMFLNLCPAIQEDIILGDEDNFRDIPEYKMRPIFQESDPAIQLSKWKRMTVIY